MWKCMYVCNVCMCMYVCNNMAILCNVITMYVNVSVTC
jgi:hypothetical protein